MSFLDNLLNNINLLTKRHKINAIHDDDIENVLTEIGILEKINAGEVLCSYCNNLISLKNLAGWIKKGDNLLLFCDENTCLLNYRIHNK